MPMPRKRAHDRRLEAAEPRRRSRLATCARNTIAASDAPHPEMAASPLKRSRAADEPRCRNRRGGAMPHRGTSLIPVLRRGSGRSACSPGVKPILSKRADCRSPADGDVHAGGGVAVEKDVARNCVETDVELCSPPERKSCSTGRRLLRSRHLDCATPTTRRLGGPDRAPQPQPATRRRKRKRAAHRRCPSRA